MVWKRFSVSQAEVVACGIEDMFLRSCIAQAQCLLNRIAGDMGKAASSLDNVSYGTLSGTMDPKMHSTIGQAAIQRSLNCVQVDDPLVAMQLLIDWKPLDQDVSLMEITTLFRRDLLLGRILRFQGKFEDSFTYLQRSQKMAEQHKNLIFDEDLRDLVCDLADTLRELEDPVSAEHHLRTQIARQAETGAAFSGQSLLELSLAEALFAQRCYEEAKRLCLDIQLRSNLLKAEKLRLRITLAKIYHVEGDFGGALTVWSQAMESLRKFPLTNGHTTRIIVISICDTLSLFGQTTLVKESLKQLDNLDELAKPGGTLYWIAGLRHWFIYLQSRSVRSRI
jgi:tetratricopeptide (TPR) repeat protein